jgi:hypothetical protein
MSRSLCVFSLVAVLAVLTGCAEPPHKEMNQAQGAIDAARAAGADTYASTQLAAATDALKRSEEAVTQNDYRLALSHAIDARERAQNAAKTAVETRAKARGNAERIVAEVNAALIQARERATDDPTAKPPRRTTPDIRDALGAAEKTMQEARAALEQDDYDRAIAIAKSVSAQITEALALLEKPAPPPPARKRR